MTSSDVLINQIDAILPQTQCTQCGYDGCLPYARAIAEGATDINRCPPGGQDGADRIARLLGRAPVALDTTRGLTGPLRVAVIDETHCIGCTLCIQACPVDAIVGASKLMHTVIADQCTGCDLCVPPCPVDCITMMPAGRDWTGDDATTARRNHQRRQARIAGRHTEAQPLAARTLSTTAELASAAHDDEQARQDRIAQAMARARARRKTP